MSRTRTSAKLEQLIEEAEKDNRCIVGTTPQDAARLRRAASAGKLISPFPRLYVKESSWTNLNLRERSLYICKGLQRLHPNWVFAGLSAALVHGLPVTYSMLTPVCVATSYKAHERNLRGIIRIIVEKDEPTTVNGLKATSLERTVFDCLRILDFPHGLAVADSALRKAGKTRDWLVTQMEAMPWNCKGYSHALATALWADPRAESGGESIARGRMLLLGYELPDLQVAVPNKIEGGFYYGDFGWKRPNGLLLGELDGRDKYTDPEMTDGKSAAEVMADERLRESRVSAAQATVMRFSFKDMMLDEQFRLILDTYGVPRASREYYRDGGARFAPTLAGTVF